MSNSGRKMSTPGWCTFALLGGVMVVAFGAFASASPWDKTEARLVPAAEKTLAGTVVDHAAAVPGNHQAVSSKKSSTPTALSEVQAGSSPTLSTVRSGAASAASLTEVQEPRGNTPSSLSGMSLIPDATRSAMGGGVDWSDDFESYPDGNCMHGEGGWEGWDNTPAAEACLQEVTWHSSNSAVDIDLGADLVRVYSGYTSGVWNYCTWQFIPDNFSGLTYFIMLNTYPAFNWSVQVNFASATGLVTNDGVSGGTLPMLTGEWVEVCVEIDLDNDTQTFTYGGNVLYTGGWTTEVSGGGALNIGAVDLFANGASSVFYDDLTLIEKLGADCGDGVCDPGEHCDNCPADCGGPCECGNGDVEPGEDCELGDVCANGEFCLADCTCPGNQNDDCEDRIDIEDGVTSIDTTSATTDGLPTSGLGDCNDFGDPQIHNDIWFNYTATCSGELTVSTCDTVNYDSKIAIYDDCDLGLCPRGGDEIGCNDDGLNCAGFSTIATADVLEGNCYKLRIGGFDAGEAGTGTVNIDCAQGLCGNGVCDSGDGEDECNCPADCPGVCPFCGDGSCDEDENECSCPADCPGECACFIFNNQAEFEAFNEEEGKTLKGIEDFEEGTLPPGGVAGMDDPLCGGIPSSPAGTPYPDGLLQLNMCVQSNTLAGNPTTPSPLGLNGLVAAATGFLGVASDVVLANYFVDSWDLMLTSPPAQEEDDHTGVGFNTVSAGVAGAPPPVTVEIRVYNKANVLLVETTSPVDSIGTNFWGVWCSDPIGRINVYDIASGDGTGTGAEGGDNIQLWFDVSCDPPCTGDATCIGGSCCGDGNVDPNEGCDTGGGCGSCPWDVSGDGFVSAIDLGNLLGCWSSPGPPGPCPPLLGDCPCLDSDGDGCISAIDLGSLLGAWGDCPSPLGGGDGDCPDEDCLDNCQCVGRGACCGVKGPGTCDEGLTADECAAAGGDYAGDDTICDDCPDPACVGAEGSCFDDHGLPGCCQEECCAIVCNIDPVCCEGYDDICVGIANAECAPPSCGDGCCDPGESVCNCNQDCEGKCPFACTVFNNQADFEVFNQEEGKVLKGVEDYENMPPGTGVLGFSDPLCGGIPQGPFPNGLEELNICVQANLLADAPTDPAPHGANGLVAVEFGQPFGNTSDLVLANYFAESTDLMFGDPVPPDQQDNHTGVGFNTVTLLGGTTVNIKVFNKNNEEMLTASSAADTGGTNFWGVWCNETIGRINIFDPGGGAQTGDNIQMWLESGVCGDGKCTGGEDCESCEADCDPCPICGNDVVEDGEDCDPPGGGGCAGGEVCLGDCTCGDICGDGICGPGENECTCSQDCAGVCACIEFNNQAEFEAFNEETGKFLKDIVDYEEMPPGTGIIGFNDPLCGGVPNGPFPNGLLVENFCIQSNLLAGAPVVPSPRGVNALVTIEFGSGQGESSDLVLSNYFADSTDLMFGDPVPPDQQDNHTGIGFDTVTLLGGNSVQIRVYDKNNIELLSTTSPADTGGTNFWGVWCSDTIGRLNIFDPGTGAETGDNIQLWKDVP